MFKEVVISILLYTYRDSVKIQMSSDIPQSVSQSKILVECA